MCDALTFRAGWWPGIFGDDRVYGGGKDDAFGDLVHDDHPLGPHPCD